MKGENMASTPVGYHVEDQVAWLTLQRPDKLNALDQQGWDSITAALNQAADDEAVRVVALTGSGRAFCAGDDINVFQSLPDRRAASDFFLGSMYETLRAIIEHPKPVVAAVNGLAYGGGLEIVAVCDFALCATSATFSLPEGRIGAWPTVFVGAAPWLMPLKQAKECAMQMPELDATRAREMGLVNQVVAEGELTGAVRALADDLMRASPQALRLTKEHLNTELATTGLQRIHTALCALVEQTLFTPDLMEGTAAFLAKREPRFTGAAR